MGKRGPHPKPVEAKILAGTFQACRDGPVDSAVLAVGAPVKPSWLEGEALRFWEENLPRLANFGLGVSDTDAFATMCQWWGRYQQAGRQLDKLKDLSTPKARKLMMQTSEAFRNFQSIAVRFGLTPADRTRLRVEPQKKTGVATRQRA